MNWKAVGAIATVGGAAMSIIGAFAGGKNQEELIREAAEGAAYDAVEEAMRARQRELYGDEEEFED